MKNNIIEHEETNKSVEINQPVTPANLLSMAVSQGADLDKLEKLMDMQDRWEANEAKKAYVSAMAKFKANPPKITKDQDVKYGQTAYSHASLANICNVLGTALGEQGLSYRWDTQQLDSGVIKVTCILTHKLGHSESTPLQSAPDASGGKNSIQAIGSTCSYLERYTLLAATGMATGDMDDDGQTIEPIELVNEAMLINLRDLLKKAGKDEQKYIEFLGIESLECLPASQYNGALKQLKRTCKNVDNS